MPATSPLLLSIVILAVFALLFGGARLIWRGKDRFKGALMLIAALVLLGNALIWVWPFSR